MKIADYISERKLILCMVGSIIGLVNLFILSSKSIIKDITELQYLDVLILLVVIFFLAVDYSYMKKRFGEIIKIGNISKEGYDNDKLGHQPIRAGIDAVIGKKDLEIASALEHGDLKVREINDYISKWIHEIKIPISIIDLTIESLSSNQDLKELSEKRQLLYDQNHRIKGLVDQALYGVKITSYHEDYIIDEIDIDVIIRGLLKKNSNLFIGKGIELEYEEVGIRTSSDRKWLSYAIEQILINAVKYSHKGGTIKVYSDVNERYSSLYIEDNGIGIMKSDIDRIYDRGFTGSNGRNTYKSTGMGLYFTKIVLDKLSHGIRVESEVGKYTRFQIMFYNLDDYYLQDN